MNKRLVIFQPDSGSYFYRYTFPNRIRSALQTAGYDVKITSLYSYLPDNEDYGLFMNLAELVYHFDDPPNAISRINQICQTIPNTAGVLAECVETIHFKKFYQTLNKTSIRALLDLGYHNQARRLPPQCDFFHYHFVFNGFTQSELKILDAIDTNLAERTIPWTMIGANAKPRVQLVDLLRQSSMADGFVFLATTFPVDNNQIHFDESQLLNVLAHSQYTIWTTHHPFFYIESERFRQALLCGSVPIKIHDRPITEDFFLKDWIWSSNNLNSIDEHNPEVLYRSARRLFREQELLSTSLDRGLKDL